MSGSALMYDLFRQILESSGFSNIRIHEAFPGIPESPICCNIIIPTHRGEVCFNASCDTYEDGAISLRFCNNFYTDDDFNLTIPELSISCPDLISTIKMITNVVKDDIDNLWGAGHIIGTLELHDGEYSLVTTKTDRKFTAPSLPYTKQNRFNETIRSVTDTVGGNISKTNYDVNQIAHYLAMGDDNEISLLITLNDADQCEDGEIWMRFTTNRASDPFRAFYVSNVKLDDINADALKFVIVTVRENELMVEMGNYSRGELLHYNDSYVLKVVSMNGKTVEYHN